MALAYTKTLQRDEDGDMVARIAELRGCAAHGADEKEALRNLTEAQRLWLEDCLEAGDAVPGPEQHSALPSGKWVQRVPRSLHGQLAMMAKAEGVSLNQLVTSMLSQQIATKAARRPADPMARKLRHVSKERAPQESPAHPVIPSETKWQARHRQGPG
jgi:predicted RNase H-like HicB family nuclease